MAKKTDLNTLARGIKYVELHRKTKMLKLVGDRLVDKTGRVVYEPYQCD